MEFISESADSGESTPVVLLKTDSSAVVFPHGFFKIDLFKILEKFCEIFIYHFFSNTIAGIQSKGCSNVLIRTSMPIPK